MLYSPQPHFLFTLFSEQPPGFDSSVFSVFFLFFFCQAVHAPHASFLWLSPPPPPPPPPPLILCLSVVFSRCVCSMKDIRTPIGYARAFVRSVLQGFVRACVCVCITMKKKVPDEWQARQATPAILQVSSSKHNAKKITTRERGLFHQSITAILTEEKREEKQFTKPTHVAVYLFRDLDRERSRL